MAQVSGSISLDMTKVQREIEKIVQTEVSHEINRQVVPALAQIHAALNQAVLTDEDMTATLACYLPAGAATETFPTARQVAEFQAERLREMGYALVAVAGPALEHAQRTRPELTSWDKAVARADARLAEATRNGADDSWFERDAD